MKLIYYSTAYYASHGGSNHSKAFVSNAGRMPGVELTVFPAKDGLKSPIASKKARGLMRRSALFQVLSFFRRRNFYLGDLFKTIEAFKPDAIVIRLDNNFAQLPELKAKFPDLVVATEINASPFDESYKSILFKGVFRWWERKVLLRTDMNFFVSDFLRKTILAEKQRAHADFVLPNGVDISLFQPSSDKSVSKAALNIPRMKVLGYVGTLDVTKKIDLLISALLNVLKKRDDVFVVVVGDGPDYGHLVAMVEQSGFQNRFLITGNIEHSLVPKYVQTFDIAIHHAANDYMCPIKLFEYLAVRIPVIAPDTPAVREVFKDREHVVYVRPDASDIENKIDLLLNNAGLCEHISRNGFDYVVGNFTWFANAKFIIDRIQERLKKR